MVSLASKPVFLHAGDSHSDHDVRVAGLDIEALRAALFPSGDGEALTLNLFDDQVLRLRTTLIEPVGDDGVVWRGALPGMPGVRGYLSAIGLGRSGDAAPMVAGWVMSNGRHYAIGPAADGKVRIARVRKPLARCGDPLYRDEGPGAAAPHPDIELADQAPETAVIRILALYPTGIEVGEARGAAAVEAVMAVARAQTNEAFHHSGIDARVEIVVRELPALPRVEPEALLTAVSGTPNSALWKAVSEARDQARASVVALLTDQIKLDRNLGYVAGKAANIPEPPRLDASDLRHASFAMVVGESDSAYTFAHEFGHLLGGKHDRLTQPVRGPLDPQYDYVRGYVPADKSFVTIMGYEQGLFSYVPAYSAADRSWNGKALGVPIGQPDAADAARFFRLSTRVVARYRGEAAPADELLALVLSIHPRIAGVIMPGTLGPYQKGSVVRLAAAPRVGYRFSRWLLDGENAGAAPEIMITMDKAHALQAEFVDGDQWCELETALLPAEAGGRIRLTPPGPAYPPGSDVRATLSPLAPGLALDRWELDGQAVGDASSVYLCMERRHRLEARLKDTRTLEKDTAIDMLEANGSQTLAVRVFDKESLKLLPDQWITFTLLEAPGGTTLEGGSQVRSNADGYAQITLRTGPEAGAVKVGASLPASTVAVRFDMTIARRFIAIVGGNDQHLFNGEAPLPLTVQVRDLGKPAGEGVKVDFAIEDGKTGLGLPAGQSLSNVGGEASLRLTGEARNAGVATVSASAAGASKAARFTIRVVGERVLQLSDNQLILKVGEPVQLRAAVIDDNRPAEKVTVHFALEPGGTGLRLQAESGVSDAHGRVPVPMSPATASGEARLAIRAAHAKIEPILQTCVLQVKSQRLEAVSGDRQHLFGGDAPAPLRVRVHEFGKPAAGVKVDFAIRAAQTGLGLSVSQSVSDEKGEAGVQLNGAIRHPGEAVVTASTAAAFEPVRFAIRAVAERNLQLTQDHLTLKIGDAVRVRAHVIDDGALTGNVPVHFTLEAGGTGIKLQAESRSGDIGGVLVPLTPATAVGEAWLTVHAAHAKIEPILQTCRITVEP
ncbi:hypothetical protein CXB49_12840 [Chromobacterium sp. ATCC 53434]|nr:hypothetical protein CXB49_12840 [Chromobacterium sp. ATCC 53434]